MKRKLVSMLMCAVMVGTSLAGTATVFAADEEAAAEETTEETTEESSEEGGEKEWEYKEAELTFLIDPDTSANLFMACQVGSISFDNLVKKIWPWIVVMIVLLLLVTYVEGISMALPRQMFYEGVKGF